MAEESNLPIFASIAANVAIAATKLVAAGLTKSSAMLAEGIHSLVDSADGVLLLFGRHRSRRPPDARHPFGYGQELYFWSLMVAMVFFAVGGGVSIYEGIQQIRRPEPLTDPSWSYVVLGMAALFDGTSFVIAYRSFRKHAGGQGVIRQIRRSTDPSVFAVVLEDSADLAGIMIAFLGVYFGHRLNKPYLDGIASVGVGLVLAVVAVVLLRLTKSLIIGQAANDELVAAIRVVVAQQPSVAIGGRPLTVHLGPHEIFMALSVEFLPELPMEDVTRSIDELEAQIRQVVPDVKRIFIEAARPGAIPSHTD